MNKESTFYYGIEPILQHIRLAKFKALWRKKNPHNETVPGNMFPIDRVTVGKKTYGELFVYGFDNPKTTLQIGSWCSIAGGVKIWLGGEHPLKFASTFPIAHKNGWSDKVHPELSTKGSVKIEDDVWIGDGIEILSGVTIGQGSVVGAGAIVCKDIPPYAICVGSGRIVGYRFSNQIINKLLRINFSAVSEERIKAYRKYCDLSITEENVDMIIDVLVGRSLSNNGNKPSRLIKEKSNVK